MYDIIIIVPYRDRLEHMEYFIQNYSPLLKKNLVNSKVIFIEQDFSNKYFNRGMLLNIGFNLYKNKTNFYITHDIDTIATEEIIQEIFSINNYDAFKIFEPHSLSLGGIAKFSHDSIFSVNGFPNYIWGWGIEDRVLYYRYKILKKNCKISNYGLHNKTGFIMLEHKKNNNNTHPNNYSGKNNISDNENNIFNSNNLDLQINHIMSSGLNNLQYKILERKNINDYIEIIKVSI